MLDADALLAVPTVSGGVQVIDSFSRIPHVAHQLNARNTFSFLPIAFTEPVEKCPLGQFDGDD
jgi:hypothetical protein